MAENSSHRSICHRNKCRARGNQGEAKNINYRRIMRTANPNTYYYDKKGGIEHSFWLSGSNPKLADIGKRNNLPCGGHWIIGDDFAFCIEYAADSWNHMSVVREFGVDTTEKWHELRMHLCEVERNWHTLKTRKEVAAYLGIKQLQTNYNYGR